MPGDKNNAFVKKWVWDKIFKVVVLLVMALLGFYGIVLKYNYAGDAEAKKSIALKENRVDHNRDIDRIEVGLERIEKKQEEGFKETRESMSAMQILIIEEIKKGR